MTPDALFLLMTIAVICAFTPGPSTLMAATFAAQFGVRSTLPHVLGSGAGYAGIAACSGSLAGLLAAAPALAAGLKGLGAAVLIGLAAKIALGRGGSGRTAPCPPFSFVQSCLFQTANPKAWAACLAAASQVPSAGLAVLAAVFFLALAAGVATWTILGGVLRGRLSDGPRQRRFNLTMGGSLAAVVLTGLAF
ncbi:MAG: LysE family translocator [Pseudomonadota bacterium]